MDATELAFAGIARQAELVRDGEVSPSELVDVYLDRIERLDPELNAFRIVFDERARAEAKQAVGRRGAGGAAGSERPLLGVPIAVKDNVHVAGEVTANGSNAHGGVRQAADSEVVRRLRAAGAIVIGKTHMSELAIFPFTETAAWGQTRNPWDTGRSAGGSSGGSAAAVAAGMIGAAYASDGGGSIRIPASTCGLFGLKPQRGRVSLAPDPEHWHGLSAAGCVTRRVADSALYLDAVAGASPGDLDTPPAPDRSFVEACGRDPGQLRVALSFKPSGPAPIHPDVRAAVEKVADVLRSLGHEVREADPDYGVLLQLFMPRWLRGIHDDAALLPHPERLETRSRRLAFAGRLVGDGGVRRARAAEAARREQINSIFASHDVLLTPTITHPPDPLGRYEGRSIAPTIALLAQMTPFTTPWNVTGQPAASIPAPVDGGMPIGAQLVGRPNDEATLLSLAAQLERELRWPDLRPPVG